MLKNGLLALYINRVAIQYCCLIIGMIAALIVFGHYKLPVEVDALKTHMLIYAVFPFWLVAILMLILWLMAGFDKNLTQGKGVVDLPRIKMRANESFMGFVQKILYIIIGLVVTVFKGYFLTMGFVVPFILLIRGV